MGNSREGKPVTLQEKLGRLLLKQDTPKLEWAFLSPYAQQQYIIRAGEILILIRQHESDAA